MVPHEKAALIFPPRLMAWSMSSAIIHSLASPTLPPVTTPIQLQEENLQLQETVADLLGQLQQCKADKLQLQNR